MFEREHGQRSRGKQFESSVLKPHHSPVWQSIAKDMNAWKSTREILEIVEIE
jgi:hypothetical protein